MTQPFGFITNSIEYFGWQQGCRERERIDGALIWENLDTQKHELGTDPTLTTITTAPNSSSKLYQNLFLFFSINGLQFCLTESQYTCL
ncbi:hypothetical protein L2E82_03796 [Cichorium intybus]|uniref:Uncharacterized protein n=1 Tax=Cichorium intybus TaxID=13427 RepID=A0ACB9H5B3_CICIN|nr:hypothetical protein L2E82_03796 [Cichorium intybus]